MKRLTKEQFINNFYNNDALGLSPSILDFLEPPSGDSVKTTCYVLPVKNLKIDNKTGIPVGFNLLQVLKMVITFEDEFKKYAAHQKDSPFQKIKEIVQKFSKILQSLQSKFDNGVVLVFEILSYDKGYAINKARVLYNIVLITSKNGTPAWAELHHTINIFFSFRKNLEKEGKNPLNIKDSVKTNLLMIRYIRDLFFINIKEDSELFKVIKEHLPQVESWRKELLATYGITNESQITRLLSGNMEDEQVIDFYIRLLLGTSINYDSPQEIINHIPIAVKKAIFVAIFDEIDNYVVRDIHDYYSIDNVKEDIKNSFNLEKMIEEDFYLFIEEAVETYFLNDPVNVDEYDEAYDIEDIVNIDEIIEYVGEYISDGYFLNENVIEPLKNYILSQVEKPSYYVISKEEAIEMFKEMLWDYINSSRQVYIDKRDKEEIIEDITNGLREQELPHFIHTVVELIVNFAAEKFEEDEDFIDFIYDLVMSYVKIYPESVLEPFNESLKPNGEIIEEVIKEEIERYFYRAEWYMAVEKVVEDYLRN